MERKEILKSWLRSHIGKDVEIITKGHIKVVGKILAVDDYGNVQIETADDFGDSTLVQRSSIDVARPIRKEVKSQK